MSVFHVLYQSYLKAEEKGLVDNPGLDETGRNIFILPIFHMNKRSSGNDVLEIILDEHGKPSQARLVPEGVFTVFPILEKSLNRTSGASAHPFCDQMEYLSNSLNLKRYENYCETNSAWTEGMIEELESFNHPESDDLIIFLNEVKDLVRRVDLFELTQDLLQKSYPCEKGSPVEDDKIKVEISPKTSKSKAKYKTINLSKLFISFKKEYADEKKKNIDISRNKLLHDAHIQYIRKLHSLKTDSVDFCDISGKRMYCTRICRSPKGRLKAVSVSHPENYWGRFQTKDEVYHMGFETSEKIMLMLQFFLDHKENNQYLYDNTTAVLWFGEDILNQKGFNLKEPVTEELFSFLDNSQDMEENYENTSMSNPATIHWKKIITGQEVLTDDEEKDFFYLVLLFQHSNGRIAIQLTRTIPVTGFIENLRKWKDSCSWLQWDFNRGEFITKTPEIWKIIYMLYGLEEEGHISLREDKIKSISFSRLLPTIIEGRPLPQDMARKMFANFKNRRAYPKTWPKIEYMTCALLNKHRLDQGKERRLSMLEHGLQNRDYLYGRLFAIYEKIEIDATAPRREREENQQDKIRITNVEKFWSSVFQAPEKNLGILKEKTNIYLQMLKKDRPGIFVYYDKLLAEILSSIREDKKYENNRNKCLKEDAVFGYYAQKKEFYTKKENKEETNVKN